MFKVVPETRDIGNKMRMKTLKKTKLISHFLIFQLNPKNAQVVT